MGRYVFRLPDIGEGVTEAEIAAWHVAVGDTIQEDQPLCDVLTDKATVDMTSPVRGVVRALHGEVGSARPVGAPLVELEVEGEVEPQAEPPPPAEATVEAQPAPPVQGSTSVPVERRANGGPTLAAPAVRARAKALGIDLAAVVGSGPEGRVTHADLDARLARSASASTVFSPPEGAEAVKVVGLRRKIAERMELSARSIPHFTYVEEIDVTALEALRGKLNAAATPRLTLLPFVALAVVRTLPSFPRLNALYDDSAGVLHQSRAVHLGVAAQTDNGLMVPVVRNAQTLGLKALAQAIASAAAAARDGSAAREALSGSTITVSSLGNLGGVAATPVINHPEVAIIAPNKVRDELKWIDGQPAPRRVMNLSSTFDHRIVDGHDAASFIAQVRALLESPEMMLLG